MHPKNFISDAEHDSIGKVHMRLDLAFLKYLEDAAAEGKPVTDPGVAGTMMGALQHRQAYLEWYINHGALDEQISDRLRYEMRHVWGILNEASLKLKAISEFSGRLDVKLKAISSAIELLDFQQHVMNDAVPPEYKFRLNRLASEIRQALAA